MRLLDATTHLLHEFHGDDRPKYAILSHTWGNNEVIFEDMQLGSAKEKPSYDKVQYTCKQALADGLEWVWIDSCCIDKSSSAELSEAINSMHAWYQQAERCYAYLSDVPAEVDVHLSSSAFAQSRWFTRGWTLQELLAPEDVTFFSQGWIEIGTKSQLTDLISTITRIDRDILAGTQSLDSASLAKRMSWAASRKTTRSEDLAYCLMGIFSVNMPMLYGEGGEKAFLRLQGCSFISSVARN
jgi:Heterokaryon incompatibility protein (HET)